MELKKSDYYKNITREHISITEESIDNFHLGLVMGISKAHLARFPQDEIKSEDEFKQRLNTLLEVGHKVAFSTIVLLNIKRHSDE